jgi:heme/copper-type cytochrome/quinol oxidase subunit 4
MFPDDPATTETAQDSHWTMLGYGWPFWLLMVVLTIIALVIILNSYTIVEKKTIEVIERLGNRA